jgi:uncharacterized membrane protein
MADTNPPTEPPAPEPAADTDDRLADAPGGEIAPADPDAEAAMVTATADAHPVPAAPAGRAPWWRRAIGAVTGGDRPRDDYHRSRAVVCGWILAVAALLWALVFSVLVVKRQNYFGTYSFDLGVYDQSVYLLSRFEDPFITVRGLHQWGFHGNFLLYLYVPFYWLGFGPNVLNVSMVLSFAAGAYPVYRIGRHYFRNPMYGLVFGLLYLANPSLQFMAWETFHPDGMAILPLLFAWLFVLERRWKAFAVACAVAVLWKEDVALAIAAMGLFVVLFVKGHRIKGLVTIVLAAAYFQLINKVLLGHFTGDAAFYNTWFGPLGDSPPEIAYNMVRHPDIVVSAVRDRYAAEYAWKMLTPFAWLPVLSPGVLMIGLPQFLANILADQTFFRDYRYHYASMVLVGLTVAAIASVKTYGTNRGRRAVLMGLLVVCGVRTSVMWGLAPYSDYYDRGFWVHQPGPSDDARREAVAMVPGGEAVSAIYNLLPHVSHREKIFDYPNPWIPTNWGIAGEGIDDPATVDYLLVERPTLGNSTAMFEALTAPGGQFEIVFERDGVVLAERVRPPEPGEVLPGTPAALAVPTTVAPTTTSPTLATAGTVAPAPASGDERGSKSTDATGEDRTPTSEVATGVPDAST